MIDCNLLIKWLKVIKKMIFHQSVLPEQACKSTQMPQPISYPVLQRGLPCPALSQRATRQKIIRLV